MQVDAPLKQERELGAVKTQPDQQGSPVKRRQCHTGTNLSGIDLHSPEGRQAGEPDVNPCRYDKFSKDLNYPANPDNF